MQLPGSSRRQFLVFFFSSRRRHTRSLCDWSSDVCSSDLRLPAASRAIPQGQLSPVLLPAIVVVGVALPLAPGAYTRSEERRVGKECRSRRAAGPEKTKDNEKKPASSAYNLMGVRTPAPGL